MADAPKQKLSSYDDVDVYPIDDDVLQQILTSQNECSFCWGTRDHWPVGVVMTYVYRDGKFWLTATRQRARIHAVRRDPRVSLIVTSMGTRFGPAKSITVKGRCRIVDDPDTLAWLEPAIARAIIPDDSEQGRALADRFAAFMHTEKRVALEVTPEKWITFDAAKMMAVSLFADD